MPRPKKWDKGLLSIILSVKIINMLKVEVQKVVEYSKELAVGIGQLMLHIDRSMASRPIAKDKIEKIIASDDKALFVANIEGVIAGMATMNIINGLARDKAWLRDFVVVEEYRKKGVGDALWQEIVRWCKSKDVDLLFASDDTSERVDARRFYEKHGAKMLTTNLFFRKIQR
jgi:GNAT superfamily N-acetyltransferase